jgi:hypothetical protein
MPSQSPHPVTSPVGRNVRSLAYCQNQPKCGPSANSQLPPGKRCVSIPAGERDSSQGGSSVASTIHGQNSTSLSSLNNSRVPDITQRVTATPSATQRRSIIAPTAMPGTSSRNTPAPSGIPQTDSKSRVVSSPTSGIASTRTSLSGLENLPTPTHLSCLENLPTAIPDPEACAIITYPLRTRATERNQRERQWQLQPEAVSTPRSVVSGSRSIHRLVTLT